MNAPLFFVVQITPGESTRFHEAPQELFRRVIQQQTEGACVFYSNGTIPDVVVRPVRADYIEELTGEPLPERRGA